MGNLSQLQSLGLWDNQLSGTSQTLWVISTKLSSSARSQPIDREHPGRLGGLSQLQDLYLTDNRLTGSIPDSLGDLPQLQLLDLGYNQLSGSIPNNLGNLRPVADLGLSANQLSGGIPVNLGNLSSAAISRLGLSLTNSAGAFQSAWAIAPGCNFSTWIPTN